MRGALRIEYPGGMRDSTKAVESEGDSHVSLRLRMSAGFAISSLSREGDLLRMDLMFR